MKKYGGIIIVFVIGLTLVISPHVIQRANSKIQQKKVTHFQKTANDLSEIEVNELLEKAYHCNEKVKDNINDVHDPFADNKDKFNTFNECLQEVKEVDVIIEDGMFGALEIPKLKLLIPIYLGSSAEELRKGVGQVEGTSLPLGGDNTHTVLAGHRGMMAQAMFRDIDELYDGDIFYIHTLDETLTYEVFTQKVIYPSETDDLQIQEDRDMATLLTCHPYRHNYQRLLIQAERID